MSDSALPARPEITRRTAAWFLAVCAAVIVLSRALTYSEPIECDLAIYSVIGHEWLGGRPLYSDLWDNKPPGVHVTWALAETLFGYGPPQVFAINVGAALVSLAGLYLAGSALTGRRAGGLWAAALWTAVSGHHGIQANQPNSEVLVNASLVAGFALLARRRVGRPCVVALLAAAAFLVLATFYKQLSAALIGLVAVAHVVHPPGGAAGRRGALRDVAVVALVGAAAWGAVVLWFSAHGRFDDFWDAAFGFNQSYHLRRPEGQGVLGNLLRFEKLLPVLHPEMAPLALLAAWAVVRGTVDLRDRSWGLLTAALAGSYVMVSLPGWFYPHYHQMALPWLVLAASWTLVHLRREAPFRRFDALPAAGAAAVLLPLALHAADLRRAPEEVSTAKYGPQFVHVRDAGLQIAAMTNPGDSIWQNSFDAGLYFWSGRRPATGVVFDYPLEWDRLREPLARRIVADLERDPPAIVVTRDRGLDPKRNAVEAWAAARYEPLPPVPGAGDGGRFRLHRRIVAR